MCGCVLVCVFVHVFRSKWGKNRVSRLHLSHPGQQLEKYGLTRLFSAMFLKSVNFCDYIPFLRGSTLKRQNFVLWSTILFLTVDPFWVARQIQWNARLKSLTVYLDVELIKVGLLDVQIDRVSVVCCQATSSPLPSVYNRAINKTVQYTYRWCFKVYRY